MVKFTPMASSLIPEKPIQIFPSLAATIGLEEAAMLSILAEMINHRQTRYHNGLNWLTVDEGCLAFHMPFWNEHDIERISKSLNDKGVIKLASAPFMSSRELQFAINEQSAASPPEPTRIPKTVPANDMITAGASPIPPGWYPGQETLARIAQHNIPAAFIQECTPEFVTYWRESGEHHRSWGSKFHQHVIRKWRQHENFVSTRDQETPMQPAWRPSQDAMEILVTHAGINQQFVEDAIPEFILYWQERGEQSRLWNSRFTQHVRRQWTRYTSSLEYDTEPRRINESWQPNDDVLDVLRLANIDLAFAHQLVPEFVLYWRDSNQLHNSWNTKFLQHVKYHWAKRHALTNLQGQNSQGQGHAGQQLTHTSGSTRDRSVSEQLNDRSWAY